MEAKLKLFSVAAFTATVFVFGFWAGGYREMFGISQLLGMKSRRKKVKKSASVKSLCIGRFETLAEYFPADILVQDLVKAEDEAVLLELAKQEDNWAKMFSTEANGRFYELLHLNQKQHSKHLLMARVGDFYEFYFDQAQLVSRVLGIRLAHGKYQGKEHVFCGFPSYKMNDYVRMLLGHGFSIAKYEQYESLQVNGTKILNRKVDRIFTSGTVIEEDLLIDIENHDGASSRFIMALMAASNDEIGFSAIDLASGKFVADSCHPSALLHTLSSFNLAETIIPDSTPSNIIETIEKTGSRILTLSSINFCEDTAWNHLESLYSSSHPLKSIARKQLSIDLFQKNSRSNVLKPIGALLNFIIESHGGLLPFLEKPQAFDKPRLKIDRDAEMSLELFKSIRGKTSRGSLFSILDETVTPIGKKELHSRLKTPFSSKPLIDAHLDLVKFYCSHTDQLETTRSFLSYYFKSDTLQSLQNLKLGHAGPWHLSCIYDAICGYKKLKSTYRDHKILKQLISKPLFLEHLDLEIKDDCLDSIMKILESALPQECLDGIKSFSSLSKRLDGIGNLNPNCNQTLKDSYLKYQEMLSMAENIQEHIKKKYFPSSNVKIKFCTKKKSGSFIEIEGLKDELDLFETSDDFVRVQALKDANRTVKRRYQYKKWTELDYQVQSSYEEYRETEIEAFHKLASLISDYREEFSSLSKLVALLDVSTCFAKKALENNFSRPQIYEEPVFIVESGRHPVVEDSLMRSHKKYTPNDCKISSDAKTPLLFITGPNMGGKSTFLRKNALIVVLSHIGSFVPATSAHIGLVDQLFSRVGTSDNLANNESSFMVEMKETAFILNNATEKSFAILDEVGRGTSYEDGIVIAEGIVNYLAKKIRCRSLFATHYNELGDRLDPTITKIKSKILTKSEENGEQRPVFTYQFEEGVSKASFGLYIAKLAGIILLAVYSSFISLGIPSSALSKSP